MSGLCLVYDATRQFYCTTTLGHLGSHRSVDGFGHLNAEWDEARTPLLRDLLALIEDQADEADTRQFLFDLLEANYLGTVRATLVDWHERLTGGIAEIVTPLSALVEGDAE
jgi:hypothetical protein